MKKWHLISLALAVCALPAAYFLYFGSILQHPISQDPSEWGALGDYLGGIANPLLSFISILLIVNSLKLQRKANASIRVELKLSKRIENIRIFEERFFRLIDALRSQYEELEIEFHNEDKTTTTLRATKAVKRIEDSIAKFVESGANNSITMFIKQCDEDDHIYSCLRRFSVVIRLVSNDLSASRGYTDQERRRYFESLVNFSDFGLIRLVVATCSYNESEAAREIRENVEFSDVCKSLGLTISA